VPLALVAALPRCVSAPPARALAVFRLGVKIHLRIQRGVVRLACQTPTNKMLSYHEHAGNPG